MRWPHAAVAALATLPSIFVEGRWAEAQTCDAARVMVLLDRSTSMSNPLVTGTESKWKLATDALKDIVDDYQTVTEFGLAVFPQTQNDCIDGAQLVINPPALRVAGVMNTALGASEPRAGSSYWTPLGQAVKEMATVGSMANPAKRRYMILISDGAQSCPRGQEAEELYYKDEDRQHLVAEIQTLRAEGIKTFVIGFGAPSTGSGDDGVDVLALNKMAEAGGTGRVGCDSSVYQLPSDKLCYFQADSAADLSAALSEIATQVVGEEVCDNIDNDCDGTVDDLRESCATACGPGMRRCLAGQWSECSATAPGTETCDGQDNNCNGEIDEGCACRDTDEPRACGSNVGTCKKGVQRCVNGQWSAVCEGEIGPQPEICDGLDTNCDGEGDDCVCFVGDTEVCGGTGHEVGQCRAGTRSCVGGNWGPCEGEVGPSIEVCDGVDNDCDGLTDEPIRGEDDVPRGLCGGAQACIDGRCVDVSNPGTPDGGTSVVTPDARAGGEVASGCGCRLVGAPAGARGALVLLALAFAGLVGRRLRRR